MVENERDMFQGVEALLAQTPASQLPPPAERGRLRRASGFTQEQVARALGLKRAETVSEWENGVREPRAPRRSAYAKLLEGWAARFPAPHGVEPERPSEERTSTAPAPQPDARTASARSASPSRPWKKDPARGAPSPARRSQGSRRRLPSQKVPEAVEFITTRVSAALSEHDGDMDAASAALVHRAIPDVMELLEVCRLGGRYDFTMHPPLPDLLRKQPGRDSDDIWEARPKWAVDPRVLAQGEYQVTALDMNGAYLSALKTHLPIGALEHHLGPDEGGPAWDRRRSGIHRITPPDWNHSGMPNPLGNRDEPGPLWVTESTLRLLIRAYTKDWCALPLIHESYTSGASEGLLDKLREGLTQARRSALETGDEVTVEYIKAMYAKFVSTAGESNFNRDIYRPDWVHLIRSQAFANLWHKAEKAYRAGLRIVRMMGTDELHVIGDWQPLFTEGRDVTQVKVKESYTLEIEGT
jgi:transcriptional regulator with XRE-family HTH domain